MPLTTGAYPSSSSRCLDFSLPVLDRAGRLYVVRVGELECWDIGGAGPMGAEMLRYDCCGCSLYWLLAGRGGAGMVAERRLKNERLGPVDFTDI